MYRKILVPYDSSIASDKALEHAVKLAESVSGQVIVVHVIPEIPLPKRNPLNSRPTDPGLEDVLLAEKMVSVYEVITKSSQRELDLKCSEFRGSGVPIRAHVLVGHVIDQIVNFAKKELVDLVVLSNVGSSSSAASSAPVPVFGSVSRSIAERALCPILIVR